MDLIDSVYVINLRRRQDRLDGFLNAFPAAWLPKLRIFGAVDGKNHDLTSAERHRLRAADWDIEKLRGQWGCSFSHEAVWREINSRNEKLVLVLEDDARFIGQEEQLRKSIHAMRTGQYDILFVGPNNHPENRPGRIHDFSDLMFDGIAKVKSNLGTMSYLISAKGATDLVNIIAARGHYRAIDYIMNEYMFRRQAWVVSAPPQFKLDEGAGSDVQHGHRF